MYRKNTANQTFGHAKISSTDGSDKTGIPTLMARSIDGAAFVTATGTYVADTAGASVFQMSQADTNGQNILFRAALSGMVSIGVNILTDSNPPDVNVKNVGGTLQTARDLGLALPAVAAGANGGLPIIGTNLGSINFTGITSAIIGNVTGNLSGSVGSVTGAVGSVTGAVGSVTGSVGSVTGLTASNLDATISSRLASGSYTAPDNTSITAIKTQTDKLNFHGTQVLSDIKEVNDVTVNGVGTAISPWGP